MFKAGFVGVGFMGRGMLKNIVKKTKVEVISIHDVSSSNIDGFMELLTAEEQMKIRICSSPADVAKRSDIVCLSLPSEAITTNILYGTNGLMGAFQTDSPEGNPIVVDHGTFSREFSKEHSLAANKMGISYIDAPVSGGPGGAFAGTLTVMIGGEELMVNRAKPLIECYSTNIVHFGPIGSGTAAKLVNQALVGMHVQAAVEALCLAEKMGLTSSAEGSEMLLKMLSSSWGQSKILELTFQDYLVAQRDPKGFESDHIRKSSAPLRNLDKDFSCVRLELPEDEKLQLPILKITGDAISKSCSEELGLKNSAFLSLIELLRKN